MFLSMYEIIHFSDEYRRFLEGFQQTLDFIKIGLFESHFNESLNGFND